MNRTKLEQFAQAARRRLMEQVGVRMEAALRMEGAAAAENARAIDELKKAIFETSKAAVIERVAYIWFNRFCALRYMDVNGYTLVRAVSPAEGDTQPELLSEAKHGILHHDLRPFVDVGRVTALLTGQLRSDDAQGEAYRLLLVGVCNYYHTLMPFMFEKIDDYSELLMPVDLLSSDSILSAARAALDEDACRDVEVIGWLYQFYISEKKKAVFDSKEKVAAEDIPAVTQLFTPNWIVRYLVENSLGRLWLLNHPESRLAEQMAYYIAPEEPETDFLKVRTPEELRICDPACGSGHMLVYAFDLLYAIYQEAGYAPSEIPGRILTHNLYGIEIDERAGALAAFALTMKARARHARFFRSPVQPNICVLEDIEVSQDDLDEYMAAIGRDLFTVNLGALLAQFGDASHFGSLIRPAVNDVGALLEILREKQVAGQMFLQQTHRKVVTALTQAAYLSPRYHVVVANPPYMGGRNMNAELKSFSQDAYPDTKSDLFAMFIERGLELVLSKGYNAMVTMESWMFLSSYEKMRETLLREVTLQNMVHMPYLGKGGTSMGINFGTAATVFRKKLNEGFKGSFMCIRYYETDEGGVPLEFPTVNERYATAAAADFRKIPGAPIAYWVSERVREIFAEATPLGEIAEPRQGLATADNDRFLRLWHEVTQSNVGYGMPDRRAAKASGKKWFPYNKGGNYRKWYGNNEYVVNWYNDGHEIKNFSDGGKLRSRPQNTQFYFRESITWSFVSSSYFGVRYSDTNAVFDVGGSSVFVESEAIKYLTAYLCSKLSFQFMKAMNPTLNFQVGNVAALPILKLALSDTVKSVIEDLINCHKRDWNSYETSWDFSDLPLLRPEHRAATLEATYANLRAHWQAMTDEMRRLEEENNRIFIDAYGLQDELTPDVPLEEITLTCNPYYRYGGKKTPDELEALLRADTIRELISYAVGCMFGRYALEVPGLVLANQGETYEDYLRRVPHPSFPADRDNVIPILDGEWFADDIVERFYRFLRLTFGAESFEANLRFIEGALKKEDLRTYFVRDFYADHLKHYQKRPIYWLFSSPSGAFNALIYMHRYRPDTVSVVLNDYLRAYRSKLEARVAWLEGQSTSEAVGKADKVAALKELEQLRTVLREIDDYEREVLYPLATQGVRIDLDDGVKVNYARFGAALKPIPGL